MTGEPWPTVYRYGRLAWLWRALIALGLLAGAALLAFAVHFRALHFVAVALPLVVPALFCGWVVATRVRVERDRLRVDTLLMVPRTVERHRLGRPRLRLRATAVTHQVDAPRLWVPVRGGAPIYLDLFASIPDRRAFAEVFGPIPEGE